MQIEVGGNDTTMEETLGFADKKREIALIQLANYQQSLSKQRHGQLNPKVFQIDNLVLRKNMGLMVNPAHGKLVANWEGPYTVPGATGISAYYMKY